MSFFLALTPDCLTWAVHTPASRANGCLLRAKAAMAVSARFVDPKGRSEQHQNHGFQTLIVAACCSPSPHDYFGPCAPRPDRAAPGSGQRLPAHCSAAPCCGGHGGRRGKQWCGALGVVSGRGVLCGLE